MKTQSKITVLSTRHAARSDAKERYFSSLEFAALLGVSDRAAQKTIARALAGNSWKGHHLEVRAVPSRGGASGVRYEVAVASLPPDIAARIAPSPPVPMPAQHRLPIGPDFRLTLVQSIFEAGSPGSEARAVQLRAVAARAFYPSGKKAGQPIAERTLRAWVAAHDRGGALPLIQRKARADRGASRVIAWREWDRAMVAAGVPEAKQRQIAATLDAEVRGLWAAGEVSAANIQFSMTVRCRAIAEAAGVSLPEGDMLKLCLMPQHFAGQKDRRRARMAHIKKADAARYAADHVPRVRRHRDGLRPMDLVAVDVRHSDILYRRPDGSLATPKTIAFLDLATNRLFARHFLLPKGEAIRREHVLIALRDLASDPAWGLWRGLYLDNGGEFQLGAAPEDLTHLVDLVRTAYSARGDEDAARCGNITSRPYNPQSKVIEAIFSAFTRSVEPIYQGFIGGNRMAKKTQNQGRAPQPMAGEEAEIQDHFAEMVAFWNAKPHQRGHIKGRSPNEAFAAFVSDSATPWGAVTLDPAEFALAFGPDETRVVQPGGELHIRGRVLAHSGLSPMVGEKVRVRLPILDPTRAVVLSDKGEPLHVVEEVAAAGFRDHAGVRAHDRGRRETGAAFAKAAAGAAKMDPVAARNRAVAALPQPPPAVPMATVSVHPVLREAATTPPQAIAARHITRQRAEAENQEAALAQFIAGARRRAG